MGTDPHVPWRPPFNGIACVLFIEAHEEYDRLVAAL
jgi:hypothetical protein